ncbi:MAG: RNA ligase family protein [Bacteroidota bacterium]
MKKYPSIEQFRNVIRTVKAIHDYQGKDEEGKAVYQHKDNYPVLKFQGTIKLHGTNASIVKYSDGRLEFQSRERVLSLEEDSAGFMATMMSKDLEFLFSGLKLKEYVAVYGEWCGGNIQKGVAINGLNKMFVIFGIMVDDVWVEFPKHLYANENGIYNILQFPTYEVDIDFNHPELVQNKIIEMTISVESSCPVGKFFNKDGTGEGIVFTCTTNQDLKFKSKGEKHSSSKVKTLNSIDVELMNNINDFIELTVSESRLKQGISFFNENNVSVDSKNTGEFLRWIVTDVFKEEKDTFEASGLDEKKVKNAIVAKARIWFLNQL